MSEPSAWDNAQPMFCVRCGEHKPCMILPLSKTPVTAVSLGQWAIEHQDSHLTSWFVVEHSSAMCCEDCAESFLEEWREQVQRAQKSSAASD